MTDTILVDDGSNYPWVAETEQLVAELRRNGWTRIKHTREADLLEEPAKTGPGETGGYQELCQHVGIIRGGTMDNVTEEDRKGPSMTYRPDEGRGMWDITAGILKGFEGEDE